MGFLSKLFPSPDQVKLERQMRIKRALRSCETFVKKQNKLIQDRTAKLVHARRTNDDQSYERNKKMLTWAVSTRRRGERMRNLIEDFSSMSEQAGVTREFCGAMSDISKSIGDEFSFADMSKVQQQFAEGMTKAGSMQAMMDQMLDNFDSTLDETLGGNESDVGVADDDIDALIDKLARESDGLTEDRIDQLLRESEPEK